MTAGSFFTRRKTRAVSYELSAFSSQLSAFSGEGRHEGSEQWMPVLIP